MLRSLKALEHYTVTATDGDIGKVVNFLLDDLQWGIRYLVVETGGFFDGRQVLVSPISFGEVDFAGKRFHVKLTREKVKNSPSIDFDRPVSSQHERDYYGYYGYPYYWGYGGLWGPGDYPGSLSLSAPEERPGEPPADAHLRSAKDVTGYHIEATDGAIGHIRDFVMDDRSWRVEYMVVDTTNWWPGKSVLVAPAWTTRVSWLDRKVYLAMTREAVKASPAWTGTYPVDATYGELLALHYGGIPGWAARDRSFPPTTKRATT